MVDPIQLLRFRLGRFERRRASAREVRDPALAAALRGPAGGRAGEVRILERRALTDDLLRLRLERPAGFRFTPGQHLKLAIGGVSRKYSICSAPHQRWLELFVEHQPGGAFTPELFALEEGDTVRVTGVSGSFALDPEASEHLMVATVTGIAPFVSMTRAAVHAGVKDRFHVLHGATHADELGYADELSASPAVTYLPTVSGPEDARSAGWSGAAGRVTDHLDAHVERHALAADRVVVYACGHPGMVADVRARMGRLGYRVRTESYD